MATPVFSIDPMHPSDLPISEREAEVLDWVRQAKEEGKAFITSQPGYSKIEQTMQQILLPEEPLRPTKLSHTRVNEMGKIATVLAAMMTDIRPFWDYRTLNPSFEEMTYNTNRLAEHWYSERAIDQKNAAVVKYGLAAGSGYGHMLWSREMQDIDLYPEDPRDVYPIRPTSLSASMQDAMGVIVVKEMPVTRIEAIYPHVKGRIKADRDGASIAAINRTTRVGKIMQRLNVSPMELYQSLTAGAAKRANARYPVADVNFVYFRDDAVNRTSSPIEMGQFKRDPEDPTGASRVPANNWSYICYPGKPKYPRGRMIISTESCVIYDGPSIYWHGMFPVSKLTLDPWPWSYIGKGMLWDLLPLQDSYDKLYRHIDDKIQVMMRPPVTGDSNSVSESELRKFDPAQPGQKMRHRAIGQGIKIHEVMPIDPAIPQHIERIKERMYHLGGVQDMSQMLSLNQMPSDNTIETLLKAQTPDLRGRSRSIEVYMREIATMLAYNFAQFYTLPRRIAVLGPTGQTTEDWDFDPNSFIPAYLPSDYVQGEYGPQLKAERVATPRPRYERTREVMRHMTFHVKPGSLLESASTPDKMLYLQLARMGYIDTYTLNEKLGIPNMGTPPKGTIPERLKQQQQEQIAMQVNAVGGSAAGAQATAAGGPAAPQPPQPLPPGGNPQGRKATGQSSPQMRSDGKISESE